MSISILNHATFDRVRGSEKMMKLTNSIKVMNFSGAGGRRIFTFTLRGRERSGLAALNFALLRHHDALGLAPRVEGILADAAGGRSLTQLTRYHPE
jgi:hypothetical protein